jgi:hypothetical protein
MPRAKTKVIRTSLAKARTGIQDQNWLSGL